MGYYDSRFEFTFPDKTFKPVSVLFGPNGCGKSTALRAIELLGRAKQYKRRNNDLLFRKMIYHTDYDPTLPHFKLLKEHMDIAGVFDYRGEQKLVYLTSNFEKYKDGIVRNDLESLRHDDTSLLLSMVFIDADNPMNMKKFQLPVDRKDMFLNIAETVYGYPVSLGIPVRSTEFEWDGREETYETFVNGNEKISGEHYDYYQDLIINKGNTRVHFKSMSDGERKIATLIRNLCDPVIIDRSDVVLIDNIEMHIYFKRHARMIDKLLECFPDKQFIVTSHSGILIDHVAEKYGKDCLFDVAEMKGETLLE